MRVENLILTEKYVEFPRQHLKEILMLGHLFWQCTVRVPVRRSIRATATMLIRELRRVIKLLETNIKGMAKN